MATKKVEVTGRNGKKYTYDYDKIIVVLDKNNADHLRRYADSYFPKLNGKGNVNHAVRHILTTVFDLANNPEVVSLIKDDPSLNDDICMGLRKLVNIALKAKDDEIEDESYSLF